MLFFLFALVGCSFARVNESYIEVDKPECVGVRTGDELLMSAPLSGVENKDDAIQIALSYGIQWFGGISVRIDDVLFLSNEEILQA